MKTNKQKWTSQKQPRRGFSLLEMVAATALMASVLVPALSVMRDAMAKSRDMNRRNVLSIYAGRHMEDYAARAAYNWTLASNTNVSSNSGSIHQTITLSDDPANGGLTGQLSHLRVTVYDDVNGNSTRDANEPQVSYRTKVAKLNSYENEEN